MIDPDLVAALKAARTLPVAEIRSALAEPERIANPVLDVLSRACVDGELDEGETNLLFWGVHVLAAARETRLYRPLLSLLRHDGETLDALLGDAVSQTLAPMLNSVFDGDASPVIALLLDSTTDDTVRHELFAVLAFATQTGEVSRDDAYETLVRFDDKRVAVEGDLAWLGWEESIGILGFPDLVPRVEAARRDGRIEADISDGPWLARVLREAETKPDDFGRFDPVRHNTLDDPIAALSWTVEQSREPIRNPFKNVGRNDPCPCGSGKKFKKCCLDGAPA